MFSDSWHLVSDRHASLKAGVETSKQYFRGERWYVLKDPYRNEFFRVTEPTYHFLARLRTDRTIEDVWRDSMEKDPDNAPGQEEVIEILGQLNNANLIQSDIPANSSQLFQQYRKNKLRMTRMQLINFLFFKIPIFNPDRMLKAIAPVGQILASRFALLIWIGTVGWALKLVFENWDAATQQSSGFLSPQNLPYIFACTVLLKAIHELAHGIFCKHFGGNVNTFGIMLMVFAPLPYVDATSSWGFRERARRIAVSGAGMYAEIFIAALATFIWAETGRGTLNGVAYNIMVVASVTTILFNINPLLKFDGYYIFSDILGIANLQQRSNKMIQFLYEYYIVGYKDSINPSRSNSEGSILVFYGFAAALYRIFLMLSIAFLVASQFFEIGLLIAIFTTIVYIITPVFKYFKYLCTNRQIERQRRRAWAVTLAFITTLVILLGIIPAPDYFSQPGIVMARDKFRVHTEADGRLVTLYQETGFYVEKGQPLLGFEDPEIDYQIDALRQSIRKIEARYHEAQDRETASVPALKKQIELEQRKLDRLLSRKNNLTLRAPASGFWVSPEVFYLEGRWMPKGSEIGLIVNERDPIFIAVISQREADNLYGKTLSDGNVRLWGEAHQSIPVDIERVIQAEQRRLPSPSLGWLGGGQIEVDQQDQEGTKVVEPFFTVIASIADSGEVAVFDERTGKIRIKVGEKPLGLQWLSDARKVIQKRLKI